MARVLLTGFMKYGTHSCNPTEDLAREFSGRSIHDAKVTGIALPCTYYSAFDLVHYAVGHSKKDMPDAIICTGLDSSLQRIRLERTGRNIMNGGRNNYPDANGFQPNNEPIIPGALSSYCVNTNLDRIYQALASKGIPSEISEDADTFVCNSLLYLVAGMIQERKLPIRCAFFHTPWPDTYLDRVTLQKGKTTINKSQLDLAVETMIQEMIRK